MNNMITWIIGFICVLISLATEAPAIEATCFIIYCVCAIWNCGVDR